MFDRNANLFFEDDRVLDVETIERYRVHPVRATTRYDAMVGAIIDLGRAPGAVKVVFGPGTMQGGRPSVIRGRRGFGPRSDDRSGRLARNIRLTACIRNNKSWLAINKDHVVTLSIPIPES